MIPLTDLERQYRRLAAEIEANVLAVLRSQQLILGPTVEALEQQLTSFLGAQAAVGVSSGSDGLVLALLDAGVGPGDEVITTPLTFVATAEAICRVGARPVFVDVETEQLSICPQALRAAIRPSVKAVIVVHLFGHVGPVEDIVRICRERELTLIEDAAQAFGATVAGRALGTLGDYGVYSFFPAKILGGAGDGGLVVASPERAARIARLRVHGRRGDGKFEAIGGNYRLDSVQAAVLAAKLPSVPLFLQMRAEHARLYSEAFVRFEPTVRVPRERAGTSSAWNYYILRCAQPERMVAELRSRGIEAVRYYGTPLHRQPCLRGVCRAEFLGRAESAARGLVALPLFPELSAEERDQVIRAVTEFARQAPNLSS